MRIIRSIILLLVVSIVLTGNGVNAAQDTERMVSVASFEGEVSILNAGAEKSEAAYVGLTLDQGTRIITGKDASVVLLIDTDKEVTIGEKSYVTIEELTLEEGKEKTGFRLLTGKLWSSIKKKLQIGESYEIRTPNAIMGARGTKFSVAYTESFEPGDGQAESKPQTQLTVVEGVVATKVKTKDNTDEEVELDVKQGEKVQLNQEIKGDGGLEVEAIDYSQMDLFTIDVILQDLKNNPEDYEEAPELEKTLETVKPLVIEREANEEAEVQRLIGKIIYESVPSDESNTNRNSSDTDTDEGVAVTGLAISASTLTFDVGDLGQALTMNISPSNASDQRVIWQSTNLAVAKVDEDGFVTALGAGKALIKVTTVDGAYAKTCTVTVNEEEVEAISSGEKSEEAPAVTGINIIEAAVGMVKGAQKTLAYEILPSNADSKPLTWTSSDPSIARVDIDGKVTAVTSGALIITLSMDGFSDTCEVKVDPVSVVDVDLNETEISLLLDDQADLNATISPVDASIQNVTWQSADVSKAIVDGEGKVTGVGIGETVITVTTLDGRKTATCKVIIKPINVVGIEISKTRVVLDPGTTETLATTITPSDATYRGVLWQSDDTSIATVDASGLVTAVATGNAIITATWVEDDSIKASCSVVVNNIPVDGITLESTDIDMTLNEVRTLEAQVTPINANNQAMSWSSSDDTIVTVDSMGKVTAVGAGLATITVKSEEDNQYLRTCVVKVVEVDNEEDIDLISMTIDAPALSVAVGDYLQLTSILTPTNATDTELTWTSSSSQYATVDKTGKVYGKSKGEVTITASNDENNITAQYKLYVVNEFYAYSIKDVTAKENDGSGDGYVDQILIKTYSDVIAFDTAIPIISDFFGEIYFSEEDVDIDEDEITLTLSDDIAYGTGDFGWLYINGAMIIYDSYATSYNPIHNYYLLDEKIRPLVEAAEVLFNPINNANRLGLSFSESIVYDSEDGFKLIHIDSKNNDGEIEDITINGSLLILELEDCIVGDIVEVTNKNYDVTSDKNKLVKAKFELQRDIDGESYWVKLD